MNGILRFAWGRLPALVLAWLICLPAPLDGAEPAAPADRSHPTPIREAPHGTIPFSHPVWVEKDGARRAILPGTRPYYELRVVGRTHLEAGRLVPSRMLEGQVLQIQERNRVLVGIPIRVREHRGETTYTGQAFSELFLLAVDSLDGIKVGQALTAQTAPTGHAPTCRMTDGTLRDVPELRLVHAPSWEEYEQMDIDSSAPAVVARISPFEARPATTGRQPRLQTGPAEHQIAQPGAGAQVARDEARPRRHQLTRMHDLSLRRRSLAQHIGKKRQQIDRLRGSLQRLTEETAKERTAARIAQLEKEMAALQAQLGEMNNAYSTLEHQRAEQQKRGQTDGR